MLSQKKYIIWAEFIILLLIPVIQAGAQNLQKDIENGFLKENPVLITAHFDNHIKLIILGESYNPDNEEAIKILNAFFNANHVVSFVNKFDSEKSQSNFMIKNLRTQNKSFRVTIFLKKTGDIPKINLLRIEPENDTVF